MALGTYHLRRDERSSGAARRTVPKTSQALLLLLAYMIGANANDSYEKVGNGWCLSPDGHRLKLGPDAYRHGEDVGWYQGTKVNVDGAAPRCERVCSKLDDCIGYMTEDASACTIIRRGDHHAAGGIYQADSERRNFCWQRVRAAAIDQASSCEAIASWPDGREETRECIVQK